jgi:hypothetical protein
VLFYKVWKGHAIQLRNRIDDMPAFEGTLTGERCGRSSYLKVLRTPSVRTSRCDREDVERADG